MVFLDFRHEPGVYSQVVAGTPFKIYVCSATSGLRASCEGHLGIILGQEIAIGSPIQLTQRPRFLYHLKQEKWDSYQFSRGLRYRLILMH